MRRPLRADDARAAEQPADAPAPKRRRLNSSPGTVLRPVAELRDSLELLYSRLQGEPDPVANASPAADPAFLKSEMVIVRTLGAKNQRSFRCLRSLLASASRPLAAMLYGSDGLRMCEADAVSIDLHDVEPSTFELLLLYMHGKTLQLTVPSAMALYSLADYYDITSLRESCCEFLESGVRPDAICWWLSQAREIRCERLLNRCFETLHTELVAADATDPDFRSISEDDFAGALKSSTVVCTGVCAVPVPRPLSRHAECAPALVPSSLSRTARVRGERRGAARPCARPPSEAACAASAGWVHSGVGGLGRKRGGGVPLRRRRPSSSCPLLDAGALAPHRARVSRVRWPARPAVRTRRNADSAVPTWLHAPHAPSQPLATCHAQERDVWEILQRWAHGRSDEPAVLARLAQHIRWPLMDSAYLKSLVSARCSRSHAFLPKCVTAALKYQALSPEERAADAELAAMGELATPRQYLLLLGVLLGRHACQLGELVIVNRAGARATAPSALPSPPLLRPSHNSQRRAARWRGGKRGGAVAPARTGGRQRRALGSRSRAPLLHTCEPTPPSA